MVEEDFYPKLDGRIIPNFQDAATPAQSTVKYTDSTGFAVKTAEAYQWLISVQLRALNPSEIPAGVLTALGFPGRAGPQDNLPEPPPIALRVEYGIENESNFVDVDVGRGTALRVFGTSVLVRGFGQYAPNATAPWPSALVVSACPDAQSNGYLTPRRTVDYGLLAPAVVGTQPVPLLATRAELMCGVNVGSTPPDVLVQFVNFAGLVLSQWNYTNAEWMRREQSFPVDPLATRCLITNNGLNGQAVKLAYTLAL